ncbi:RNA-directed DNA polymerase, eukaryota [Tanacetum coccineum]
MRFMGFSVKWIKLILGYLLSATSSILINGSPTHEFNIHRGLRQGDPLSPFLFIIAMEGLHVAIEDTMAAGLYRGFKVNTLNLSHFFLADDALFIEVELFASITGCNALVSPFSYLGLPIDCNMALVKSWDPIIDKFSKRLSKWKASLLFIGGRSTLISSVLGAIDWSRHIISGTNANHLASLYNQLSEFSLNNSEDTWIWSFGTSTFSVKSTREHIDHCSLPNGGFETRWNRLLPKKINIFIWRVLRDRLPSRWNLSRKGVDVVSLSCPVCDCGIETIHHSLWFCSLATTVWNRVLVWLDLPSPNLANIQDLYSWLDDLHISSNRRATLEVICGVVLWSLWNFRNETIFGTVPPKRSFLFDKIVDCSFRWYSSRNKLSSISWNNWLRNPLEVSIL